MGYHHVCSGQPKTIHKRKALLYKRRSFKVEIHLPPTKHSQIKYRTFCMYFITSTSRALCLFIFKHKLMQHTHTHGSHLYSVSNNVTHVIKTFSPKHVNRKRNRRKPKIFTIKKIMAHFNR